MKHMTGSEVRNLVECPDCRGTGTHSTPSKNWNKVVICSVCSGTGFITKWHLETLPSRGDE